MRTKTLLPLAFVFMLFNSCDLLSELTAFAQCKFRYNKVSNTTISGVNVQGLSKFTDLGPMDALALTSNLIQKRLPLQFTINVQVQNPNAQKAAMNQMDWIVEIDNMQVAQGVLNQRVEIPANGGVSNMPLTVKADIWQLLSKEGRDKILNFGFGLADRNGKPLRIGMKVKPTIYVGGAPVKYPGYITIGYTFPAA